MKRILWYEFVEGFKDGFRVLRDLARGLIAVLVSKPRETRRRQDRMPATANSGFHRY